MELGLMFVHWLLIPVKVILIWLVATYQRARLAAANRYRGQDLEPAQNKLKEEFDTIVSTMLVLAPDSRGISRYVMNPDHQALRNGALVWSYTTPATVAGLESFILNGKFIRGEGSGYDTAPPAMGMAVAHGIVSALNRGVKIPTSLKQSFLGVVFNEILQDFAEEKDTSCVPRAASTAFDAIYALSLLYTAYRLSDSETYLSEANKILWNKGYAFLLLAPLTFKSDSDRRYFLDHIATFGLRTAYLACPNAIPRWILKHALKFVVSQSYASTNPYFCAMAHECGALPESQRKKVLDVHRNASLIKATGVRNVIYNGGKVATDWSTHSDPEFLFDNMATDGVDDGEPTSHAPISGLCLGKSLAILMGKEIQ
jgi:hypothetical protein